MVAFADLVEVPTLAQQKSSLITLMQTLDPPLPATDWTPGSASERWTEIVPRAIDAFLSNTVTQAVRAFFLELATDPGDAGDRAADHTPRPGWLSALGSGWYGVQRGNAKYASGFVKITNAGTSTTDPIAPFDLTFQRSTPNSDGGYPTYRNSADNAIYTGLGGTITLAPGASITLPITAEQIGSESSASTGQITVCQTQSFGTLTVTNAAPVLGSDREDRALYIARCRQQASSASPHGAADAYRYASTTNGLGDPLPLYDGSGVTSVNRIYVSASNSTGTVTVYLANPSGPATAVEVTSANGCINGLQIPDPVSGVVHNTAPIGVVPDTVAIGPTILDAITGAPGPAAAVATNMGPMQCTAKIKAVPGMGRNALISAAQAAIAADFAAFFSSPDTAPIGGVDQVSGAGVIYTADLQDVVKDAYEGIYGILNFTVLGGGGASTAIALGRVPVYRGPVTITAAADNGSGAIRLTVSTSPGFPVSNNQVQIYDVTVSGGTGDWLTGTWYVSRIDASHLDLYYDFALTVPSAFPGGGTFTAARLSQIVLTVVS